MNPWNPNGRGHPFWDFVADMDNRHPGSQAPHAFWARPQAGQEQPAPAESSSEKKRQTDNKSKQPSVEDEPMADADGARPSRRGLVDTEKAPEKAEQPKNDNRENVSSDEERRGGRCGRHHHRGGFYGRGRGGFGPGPQGRGGFCFPFFGPGSPFDTFDGPPVHGHHGPPAPGAGPHNHHHGGPPHGHEFHGRHGPWGRRGMRWGGRRGREPFNLPNFLSDLGSRLGIDLTAAAANLGVDLSRAAGGDYDFSAPYDLFDLPTEYMIHVSLPGARREDIAVDFEGEHNILRVAGVVYRPGVDEHINEALSHSGRSGHVGVFETKVRLGKGEDNGSETIDIDAISAKLRDGVMVIRVPKLPPKKEEETKRSIRIESNSPSPSPPREKAASSLPVREKESQQQTQNLTPQEPTLYAASSPSTEKGDEVMREEGEQEHDDPPEVLPPYTSEAGPTTTSSNNKNKEASHALYHDAEYNDDDDDDDEEEEEGEYVKINVD